MFFFCCCFIYFLAHQEAFSVIRSPARAWRIKVKSTCSVCTVELFRFSWLKYILHLMTWIFFSFFSCPFLVCSCPPLYSVIWFDASSMVGAVAVCPLSSSRSYLNAWLCPCSGTLWLAGLLAWPPPCIVHALLSFGFCSFTDACYLRNPFTSLCLYLRISGIWYRWVSNLVDMMVELIHV